MFGQRKHATGRDGLVVGPDDAVQGTIAARAMLVEGRVEGTLDVATTLRVAATGRVSGTMRATHLVVAPGASVRARCRIGLPAEAPAEERAPRLRLTTATGS